MSLRKEGSNVAKSVRLPPVNRKLGTEVLLNSSSLDQKTNRTDRPIVKTMNHMPTLSLRARSIELSDMTDSAILVKPKNRLAFLAQRKISSIIKGPNINLDEEDEPFGKAKNSKILQGKVIEGQLKKHLKFLGMDIEGFEDNGGSDLHILESKIKSYMAKLHDISNVIKTHNSAELHMITEELFYQTKTLGIYVLINSYMVFYAFLCHKLQERERLQETVTLLRENAEEWNLDRGLMIADFFLGLRYEEEMKHDMALKVYFRMLCLALFLKDYEFELKAYDLIGKQFYYLNELPKSIYFHRKFIRGHLEKDDSIYRDKRYKEEQYQKDENLMPPLIIEDNFKPEEEVVFQGYLTPSRLIDQKTMKAHMIKLEQEKGKQSQLYQVISGQKRRYESGSLEHQKNNLGKDLSILGDKKAILLTHLSIDRNIKPIMDMQPISVENSRIGFDIANQLSIELDSSENSNSYLVNENSKQGSSVGKKTKLNFSLQSSLMEEKKSLYRPKVTHSMIKQMTKKTLLSNSDIVDLLKLLDRVNAAIKLVNKNISECGILFSYVEQGLIKLSRRTITDTKSQVKEIHSPMSHRSPQMSKILSKSSLVGNILPEDQSEQPTNN